MIYVDTSVVVAYVNERDALHERALELVEAVRTEKLVVTQLVVVELYAVYSRVTGLEDVELEAVVEYSLAKLGVVLEEVDCSSLFAEAQRRAHVLRLRALDLLHVLSAYLLGARAIATFDKDIVAKSRVLEEALGLEVYTSLP